MKKSMGILVLSFMFIVLIRFIGLTYGYYSLRINDNTADKSISVDSKYLAVVYTDGTSTMNFDGDYFFPGNGAEKTFSVENTGEDTAIYNILIDNVVNEFERIQDLRYDLYVNDELIVDDGAINNNKIQYLYFDRTIEVGKKDNIRFVFTYAETEEIQNVDMNKGISFRFNIDSSLHTSATSETNSVTFVSKDADLNSYRIYGNSVQETTPTIDTPVEIQSVGDKTVNLFDKENAEVLNLTMSSGSFASSTTSKLIYIPCKASTIYTISRLDGNSFSVANSVEIPDDGVTYSINDGQTTFVNFGSTATEGVYTTSANAKYLAVIISGAASAHTVSEIMDSLQIEEGTTSTEYKPYGYEIPVTVRGKNLFNKLNVQDGYINDSDGTYISSSNYYVSNYIEVLPGQKLYITQQQSSNWAAFYDENKVFISGFVGYGSHNVPNNAKYLRITVNKSYIDKMQVEVGSNETEYEPYVEPQTYNIYLNEPLRKIGNYSDYIDFSRQVVVRNIEELIFDGSEELLSFTSNPYPYTYYVIGKSGYVIDDNCMSNYLQLQTNFSYQREGNNMFRILNSTGNSQSRLVFRIVKNGAVVSDLNMLTSDFATAYNNGKPYIFDYALAKEVESPIKLPSFKTNSGTNVFEVETTVEPSSLAIEALK